LKIRIMASPLARGLFDHDHLIAPHAEPPVGNGARRRFVQRKPMIARIENHKAFPRPCICRTAVMAGL